MGRQIFKELGENKFNGLINNTVDKKYKKFLELSGATDTFICCLTNNYFAINLFKTNIKIQHNKIEIKNR